MKMLLNCFAVGLAGGLSLSVFNARADLEVSADVSIHARADFYEPLASYGAWVEVGSYGRCWHPAQVAVEWRPYCSGHWVWTDCGWYWESDEPWAWACYHYGRWVYDSSYGWVWAPDVEWGPAWVSWRFGGGFVGWAPLPPAGVVVSVAVPSLFVFVDVHRFHEPIRPSAVIINNTTIINQTTVINNIRRDTRTIDGSRSQRVVVNEGPGLDPIQKATGRNFKAVPIREAAHQTSVPPTILRKTRQSTREEPKAAPERKSRSEGNSGSPARVAPAETGRPHSTDQAAPAQEPRPERKPRPGAFSEPPANVTPSERSRPVPREEVAPRRERPSSPGGPPASAPRPPEGKSRGIEEPVPRNAPSMPLAPPAGKAAPEGQENGKGHQGEKGKGPQRDGG